MKAVRAALLFLASLPVVSAQSQPGEWLTIKREDFCVTDGALEQGAGDRVLLDVRKCALMSGYQLRSRLKFAFATQDRRRKNQSWVQERFAASSG